MEIIIGEPQIKESKSLIKQLGINMSNLKESGIQEIYVTNVTIEYGRGYGQYYKRIDFLIDGSDEVTIKKHTTDSITYDELHNTYSEYVVSNILKRVLIELTEDIEYYA
jgi:3-methyladenine DNA glycosylase AlkD